MVDSHEYSLWIRAILQVVIVITVFMDKKYLETVNEIYVKNRKKDPYGVVYYSIDRL